MAPSSDEPVTGGTVLPSTATVIRHSDGIFTDKGNGTRVRYHIFKEYEIHANVIDPGCVQGWHHHERIIETLYVTAGSIEARWIEGTHTMTSQLDQGDIISVGSSVHTFANPFDEPAEFVVFRLLPDGTDKRDLIRNDRHTDEPPAR